MTIKPIIASAAVLALVPALALAQVGTDLNASVTAQTPVGSVHASTTLSATVMATAKSRADKEIDRRIAALNALVTRVQAMTRVTSDFKTQLAGNIQTQISGLTQLKAKIDADTDGSTLKSDVKTITDSYRIYMLVLPQSRIAAAADRAVNIATMESALGAKLKTRVDAAAAAGADVTALNTALNDLATQDTNAVTSAQAAVTAAVGLKPDNGDKTIAAANTKALQDGRGDIQTAQKDLVAARKDIETIVQGLKKLGASASVTASSSTQTQ